MKGAVKLLNWSLEDPDNNECKESGSVPVLLLQKGAAVGCIFLVVFLWRFASFFRDKCSELAPEYLGQCEA